MGTSTMPRPGRGARFASYLIYWLVLIILIRSEWLELQAKELVQRHRGGWLRDAEATLTVLDWRAYSNGRTLHVLDARAIGGPPRGYLGFAAGSQLHELAGHLLPQKSSTKPAAAVAVNVDALVLGLRHLLLTEAHRGAAIGRIRTAVAAVAAH